MNSPGDELLISQPHKGRNSGKLIVRLVRHYNKPDGKFGGVIFVALETKHITEFFNTMKIGPRSSATLVGEDKNMRARSSYGRLGPGQNISGSRIWKELESSPNGLYRQVSVVDNITRYYAYRRVPEFPLIVAIGMSVDDLYQESAWALLHNYAVALLATLLILITAAFLYRQQHLLGEIEAKNLELGKGNQEIQSKNSKLEDQNAELERFTYTVSHDLKAPLVTIKGFLGLLHKDIADQNHEAVARDAEYIGSATDKMAQLLSELLQLSRVGRQMNPAEPRNLTELVKEAASQVSNQFEEQGIRLVIEPNMPDVSCDPVRLREVYQNLIENAIKFMGDQASPHIEIGAKLEDGEVCCYVRDNGMGIIADYHDRVFDLFDRLNAKIDGTGIGLTVVKRIIEVHGGRIWVESSGEAGLGSTFWFTLPVDEN
jgi:signal transduction histidine kinase